MVEVQKNTQVIWLEQQQSRSDLPSPLHPPIATKSGILPVAKVCVVLESAVAVAQQHAHCIAGVAVGDDEIGFAVTVNIANRRH